MASSTQTTSYDGFPHFLFTARDDESLFFCLIYVHAECGVRDTIGDFST